MPGIIHFLRCVGKAVIKNAGRALANLIPFGEVVYDVSRDAMADYYSSSSETDLKRDLESVVQATPTEVRKAALAVAADQPPEVREVLTAYLTQLPASIRHALRRPSDPSGTTVPAMLSLRQPEELLPFLPTDLPRFKAGDRPLAADWELVEMLGKGGFGEVWKARHLTRSSQKPVALKFCLDPVAAQTLRNEASIHDILDRVREEGKKLPGFVPLLETYLNADPPCLMYEYIEGGDLTGLIQEAKLTPTQATLIIHRLASIMGNAHRLTHPLVHRDLKPANILLRRDKKCKLLPFVADFGIGGLAARQMIQVETRQRSTRNQTMSTAIRGAYTPLYASPQQREGQPPDPRDDVHALGVIWYQLITGDLKLLTIPPDWRDVVQERGLGKGSTEVLASCLASRPEKRLASAAELENRLTGLRQKMGNNRPKGPPGLEQASPLENDLDQQICTFRHLLFCWAIFPIFPQHFHAARTFYVATT